VDAVVVQAPGRRAPRWPAGRRRLRPPAAAPAGRRQLRPAAGAAGGIGRPQGGRHADAGAAAAQLGTAFLRCPEAGSSPIHRAAVASAAPTALTRAFTGKRARAVVNDFLSRHDRSAPVGYPQVLHLTRPLLATARRDGDASVANLWAGQAQPLSQEMPAAQLVTDLIVGARTTLAAAADRSARWD
jgi:nitronate monooxygenase